jgi:plastocyanin
MRQITAITVGALLACLTLVTGSASAGGGCHGTGPQDQFSDERQNLVELGTCRFNPTIVRVDPGQAVIWTNGSREPHTVTGVAGSWGDDRELLRGDAVTYQFDEEGVFPYFCIFHPGMVGAVVVGEGGAPSASTSRDSVKAVSAEAPRGTTSEEPAALVDEDDGGGLGALPLAAPVGLVAALAGFAGALLLRRRSLSGE